MYNPQLSTFIKVADSGSFNKTAESSGITPSAIIKQINLLEDRVGVKLFERTHRGLCLTKAGESLYKDAKYIIQYCNDAVNRAKNAANNTSDMIRIGTSPMTPAQLLVNLYSLLREHCHQIKFQIIPFENTPENAKDILNNLGSNIDVVGGVFDDLMLEKYHCSGFMLKQEPFCCAVSVNHPLASKDELEISDLYDETLLIIRRGWTNCTDKLRDDLANNHPRIHIKDFDFYNLNIFNQCENSKEVLLAFSGWANVHPMLKVIPVKWDYSMPFGLLHANTPSPQVKCFLNTIASLQKTYNL